MLDRMLIKKNCNFTYSGDTSWITRIQNDVNTILDFDPITDVSALYQATIINEHAKAQNADVDTKVSCVTSFHLKIWNILV